MVTTAGTPWLALGAAVLLTGLPAAARADDYADLVAAERAFAADAATRSVRDAFVTALTEDGVVFAPGPVRGRPVWEARPADKTRLEWAPEAAEISASGDLGYTYGPWRLTPPGSDKPVRFGHYFTVWQKQLDGTWKALADKGIVHDETPFPADVSRRGRIAFGDPSAHVDPNPPMAELRAADVLAPGRISADIATADAMVFRNGAPPKVLSEAKAFGLAPPQRTESSAVIADAGDLAVTWGGGLRGGSWLRVWRRAESGDPTGQSWRLAADISDDTQVEVPRIDLAKIAAAKAEKARIEAAKLEAAKVEAARIEAARLEAARIEAARIEAARIEAAQAEAARAEAARKEAAEAEAAKAEAAKPEATKPEATKPEATKPEATKPEATKPEAAKPEATKPEASKPEATKPEATKPEAAKPDEPKPATDKPATDKPAVATPEADDPKAEATKDE
jgi:ketosteroid isomerase-like protein